MNASGYFRVYLTGSKRYSAQIWVAGGKNPAKIIKDFKGKTASEDAKEYVASKIKEKENKGYIEK